MNEEEKKEYLCVHCGKPAPYAHNYCSDKCFRDAWDEEGGPIICPNGLPIRCWRAYDGARMEHEHADHPDYKFPVDVDYIGEVDPGDKEIYAGFLKRDEEVTDDKIRKMMGEWHALIYTDGCIAVTIYECCFAMWYLKDGSCEGGDLWIRHRKDWRLNEVSRLQILEFAQNGKRPEYAKEADDGDQRRPEGDGRPPEDSV